MTYVISHDGIAVREVADETAGLRRAAAHAGAERVLRADLRRLQRRGEARRGRALRRWLMRFPDAAYDGSALGEAALRGDVEAMREVLDSVVPPRPVRIVHTSRCVDLRAQVKRLEAETARAFRRSARAGAAALDREAAVRKQLIACHIGDAAECVR